MRTLIVTVLAAVLISTSCAFTSDRNRGSYSAAEEDFVAACREKTQDCTADVNNECCFPEVIIVNQDGDVFVSGDHNNEIILKFITVSDYLTNVQGTAYFLMNTQPQNSNTGTLARK